jgi:hypothetical protein
MLPPSEYGYTERLGLGAFVSAVKQPGLPRQVLPATWPAPPRPTGVSVHTNLYNIFDQIFVDSNV